jgi:predicted TIM-barrel fold metal-dependent hydrolase
VSYSTYVDANVPLTVRASPGSHLVDGDHESARKLARRCNEHAAKVKAQYPDKFGYWASLPLPDIEGSLAELEHAFDHLSADGDSSPSALKRLY